MTQPTAALWGAIVRRVLDFHRVSPQAFTRQGRGCALTARARQLASYLARVEFELELLEVAELAGWSRFAVDDGAEAVEDLRDDPAWDSAIDAMVADIRRAYRPDAETLINHHLVVA